MSDRIVIMTPRPGRIERNLDITIKRPRERNSAEFLKLRGEILDHLHLAANLSQQPMPSRPKLPAAHEKSVRSQAPRWPPPEAPSNFPQNHKLAPDHLPQARHLGVTSPNNISPVYGRITDYEGRDRRLPASRLLAGYVEPSPGCRGRSFVLTGCNLLTREDAKNRERNKQPIDADAGNGLPGSCFFAFWCKERDDPKNESTSDEQRINGAKHKHPNRASAESLAAEQIHYDGKAGRKKTEPCCSNSERSRLRRRGLSSA